MNATKGAVHAVVAASTRKKYVHCLVMTVAARARTTEASSSHGEAVEKKLSAASGSSQRCSHPSRLRRDLSSTEPSRPSTPLSAVTVMGSTASSLALVEKRRARASSSAPHSAKTIESADAAHMG